MTLPDQRKRYVVVMDEDALEIARAAVDSWRYTQRHLRPFHLRNREDDQVRAYLALANAKPSKRHTLTAEDYAACVCTECDAAYVLQRLEEDDDDE